MAFEPDCDLREAIQISTKKSALERDTLDLSSHSVLSPPGEFGLQVRLLQTFRFNGVAEFKIWCDALQSLSRDVDLPSHVSVRNPAILEALRCCTRSGMDTERITSELATIRELFCHHYG